MESHLHDNSFKLEILEYIGRGSFARVQRARYTRGDSCRIVAAKIWDKNPKDNDKNFSKEVNALKNVSHENIIELIDCFQWTDGIVTSPCMLMELAECTLHDVLETDKKVIDRTYDYTFGHAISWLYQCSNAINYLHSKTPKPILHRDLKPLNLLLMNGGTLLKLGDFGTVTNQKTLMSNDRGTAFWMAPEIMTTNDYNEKCDVYSYTIIAWEVMARETPYFHLGKPSANQIMLGVTGYYIASPLRPKHLSNCPKIFQLLFERGMDGKPSKRPSMSLIFKLMQKMNDLVNKTPVKPIKKKEADIENEDLFDQDSITTYDTTTDTHYRSTVKSESGDITLRTLSTEMLNGTSSGSDTSLNDFKDIARKDLTRRSFKYPFKFPSLADVKGKGHRRSRSDCDRFLPGPNTEKEILKNELIAHVENKIYDPLEPIDDDNQYTNRSIKIYNSHKKMINDDRKIAKEISDLRSQIDQLKATEESIRIFNKLLEDKKKLIEENNKLKEMIK